MCHNAVMGSNQGKQPHHADRGGKVWSRDEKRENRKVMRGSRDRYSIEDSIDSNEPEVCTCESSMSGASWSADCPTHGRHTGAKYGWLNEPYDLPRPTPKKRRKDTRRWCRGKVGQEHDPQKVREHNLFHWRLLVEYHCSRCGHKTFERKS